MINYKNKIGLTLVEIMIVVAVIAILIAMTIGIAARIDIQAKKQLTENTFALLDAALGQFKDYGYTYNSPYDVFDLPLDCNDFAENDLEDTLETALGLSSGDVDITGDNNDVYSGCEVMYFFLSRVPESKKTLDKIDRKLVTNAGLNATTLEIEVNSKKYPLLRVIDPWGETLRYDYYSYEKPPPLNSTDVQNMKDSRKTFPIITSAGPDRKFGSADDITSR